MKRTTIAVFLSLSMVGSLAHASIFTPSDSALENFAVIGSNNIGSVTFSANTASPAYADTALMSAGFDRGIIFGYMTAVAGGSSYVDIGITSQNLTGSTSFELELVNDNQSAYEYALFVTDGTVTVVGSPFTPLTGTHNAINAVQNGVNASLLSVDLTGIADLSNVTYGFRVRINPDGSTDSPSISDIAYVAFDNDGGNSIVEVPEPSSFAVLGGLGFIGLVFSRRRRMSVKAS